MENKKIINGFQELVQIKKNHKMQEEIKEAQIEYSVKMSLKDASKER